MTEERKKYLAGISREERVIRSDIEYQKYKIADEKSALNYQVCDDVQRKYVLKLIRARKIIIKTLKKQLHASRKVSFTCPVCGGDGLESAMSYCFRCGQRLR